MKLEIRVFICLVVLAFFVYATTLKGENPYDGISKRNAFVLLDKLPVEVKPEDYVTAPTMKLYLTGIVNYQNITNVFLYSKDLPKRFITLNYRKPSDSGVTLIGVSNGLVEVNNNGVLELLSFNTHKLPNIIGPMPVGNRPTVVKKESSRSRSSRDRESKEPTVVAPIPNVIKVPSRRPQVDPRIIEKSLEYISKMDDGDKREALLKRVERLQSGKR
jgi:hypothetical protein